MDLESSRWMTDMDKSLKEVCKMLGDLMNRVHDLEQASNASIASGLNHLQEKVFALDVHVRKLEKRIPKPTVVDPSAPDVAEGAASMSWTQSGQETERHEPVDTVQSGMIQVTRQCPHCKVAWKAWFNPQSGTEHPA